mgnify:CR=1 FL=1
MTNLNRLEALLRTISAEHGKEPSRSLMNLLEILHAGSQTEGDDHIIPMFKAILIELAMEDEAEVDFRDFCLYFVNRINLEFKILLN